MCDFIKKIAVAFFIFAAGLLLAGCNLGVEPTPEIPFEESVEDVVETLIENLQIGNWNTATVSKDKFEQVKSGDIITIIVSQTGDYSRVWLYDTSWKNYLFSNVTCVPNQGYVKQYNKDLDMDVSKIQLEGKHPESEITIVLNDEEVKNLRERGLLVTGQNFLIKSLKISYTKKILVSKYSFEEQYDLFASKRASTINKYKKMYDLPFVVITTKDRKSVLKKEYYESVVDLANCDSKFTLPEEFEKRLAGVKVRGNSTASDEWSPVEKPYRIKFNKKYNMFGLHEGKKYKSWVLLKTGWPIDNDYLGFKLAHEIYKTSDFDYYASDAAYVHVIINDEYKGLYLLCEQNQTNEGRVSVYEPKENETTTQIGYMIELDNYAWDDGNRQYVANNCWKGDEDYHFTLEYKFNENVPDLTDINGITRKIPADDFTLKNDIYSEEQVKFIYKYLKGVWDICYNAIEKGKFYKFDSDYNLILAPEFNSAKEACDAVLDLESLCNEMILEELVRDNDVGAGSLYMAVDFTVAPGEKYEKLTFECPWDFNWAYSNFEQDSDFYEKAGRMRYFAGAWQPKYVLESWYEGRSNSWFVLFNKTEWFREMQREKWERIGPNNLKAVVGADEKEITKPMKESNKYSSCASWVYNRINYINDKLWK